MCHSLVIILPEPLSLGSNPPRRTIQIRVSVPDIPQFCKDLCILGSQVAGTMTDLTDWSTNS